MELKKCLKCNNKKPETDEYFYKKKGHFTSPCKVCQQEKQAEYYQSNKPKPKNTTTKQKTYRNRNKTRLTKQKKRNRSDLRLLALWHYGGQPPECACCGETHIQFLCVSDHTKKLNSHRLYQKLRKDGYPDGYEVLCQNCAHALVTYGECPHIPNQPQPSSSPNHQNQPQVPTQVPS